MTRSKTTTKSSGSSRGKGGREQRRYYIAAPRERGSLRSRKTEQEKQQHEQHHAKIKEHEREKSNKRVRMIRSSAFARRGGESIRQSFNKRE
jgi:hypothetical protein